MLTIENLKKFGADTKEGLERCLGDEGFYLMLVPSAATDENYENIKKSIEAGKLDDAFEAAHALKGVLGNLALTPIYDPCSELTEHLRARDKMDYAPLLRKLFAQRDKLASMIG